MFEKRQFYLLFILFLFLPAVRANFACGQINSTGFISPSWLTVSMHYSQQPSLSTTCSVSPSENKYCCDPRAITGVPWQINSTVVAEIFEPVNGYFTDPVNLTITGQGYDVFPSSLLKRAVTIDSPNNLILSKNGTVPFKLHTNLPFLIENYTLIFEGVIVNSGNLCNCTNDSFILNNLSTGDYSLQVIVIHDSFSYISVYNFTLLNSISFSHSFSCEGCKDTFIPANATVTIITNFTASSPVHDILFYEYYPKDWFLIDAKNSIEFSSTHRAIQWLTNGQNGSFTYQLQSPSIQYPRRYVFSSALDALLSSQIIVRVYAYSRLLSYLAFYTQPYSNSILGNNRILTIVGSSNHPPVLFVNDSYVSEVAIFSKNSERGSVVTFNNAKTSSFKELDSFFIGSSLSPELIDYVYLRLRIPLSVNLSTVELLLQSDKTYIKQSFNIDSSDGKYSYISVHAQHPGLFLLKELRK